MDTSKPPAYLPAQEILKVTEVEVAERMYKLNCRKSTQPIDLHLKVRKTFSSELATPLTDIINCCLTQYKCHLPWKHEWVVPAEKIHNPLVLKDLRKISLTSEYSLVFEGIIKDWIMQDIDNNCSIVIAAMLEWSVAFDRQDPTLAIEKFIKIGVRPALIPVLVSYLSNKEMQVRFNSTYSSTYSLPGGGP